MKRMTTFAGLLVLAATAAQADDRADQLARDLAGQGFSQIEVETADGRIKAEAKRAGQTLELVYDAATGELLRSETGRGGGRGDDDDDDNDDNDDNDDDDRDDDDDRGGDDDNGGDDDGDDD
ncbi:PepSY domain-containing protein [Phaeovulum veldkampii]|uniref:PepSY domain-containing protein n=1 Tax=Phaeovulum veldkampii DSM 11550 TaxID=1185920 RepID=A0A2T4JLR1_9RHOB|nr:PepSY domain-containing protein [Phaeovulum veldkampii]PTE18836.1 PepSY domain-containing protein [Phaeovulum veldkampii DSM 11550]TDQ59934.1 YpeB-like protein with putative protease inhibitory function [Phaeovulum veldkampii DSM 11550]